MKSAGIISKLPPPPKNKEGWAWTQEVSPDTYRTDIAYPKISIITPTFNQGAFIEQTIRSILLQNYPNLEYIIIDGGSTDGTIEIIKKYEQWISYWTSEKDDGQTHAINKGLKHCTGKIFNWLNSDDWYLPNALKIIAEAFYNHPSINVVCGREYFYHNGNIKLNPLPTSLFKSFEQTLSKTHLNQPTTFFRLKIYQEFIPLREDFHYMFDAEIWLRYLIQHGQNHILKIEQITNYFRLHESSKTQSYQEQFHRERHTLFLALLTNTNIKKSSLDKLKVYLKPHSEEIPHYSINIHQKALEKYIIKEIFMEAFYKNEITFCRSILSEIVFFNINDIKFTMNKFWVCLPIFLIKKLKKWNLKYFIDK